MQTGFALARQIAFYALLIILAACTSATTRTEDPKLQAPTKKSAAEVAKPSPAAVKEFNQLRQLSLGKDFAKAIPRLKRLAALPLTSLTPEVHFLTGQVLLKANALREAHQSFLAVIKSPVLSPREAESAIQAAQIALRVNQPQEALAAIEWATQEKKIVADNPEAERIRIQANLALNRNLDLLRVYARIQTNAAVSASERESYRAQGVNLVGQQLNSDELTQVRTANEYAIFRGHALFRAANVAIGNRDLLTGRNFLSQIDGNAHPDLAERARKLIDQLDARSIVQPSTIGVVLPLTGDQAPKGYRALRGIQHALSIFGKGTSPFRLAIIDSEGNADVARRGVERLVTENHVIAIIGGFLSKTASIEAQKAQESGVPIILLSQKAGLTQLGDFVFRNALTSQSIVEQVVKTAMADGLKKFAVLYPNDAYGVEYTNLFWDEVRARGGDITAAQPYDPKETDFKGHVQRLVGLYYSDDRVDEYKAYVKLKSDKAPLKKNTSARGENIQFEEVLPPIVDFEAIFLPDSPKSVGLIAPMLAYYEVGNIRLIGTNLWNNPTLVARGEKNVENSIFADAFAFGDRGFANSEFYSSFKATFEEEPGFFELQGYESALVLRQIIASGETSRIGLQQRLAGLQKFPGPIGSLSITPQREFERRLTSLSVRNGQIVNLNPAIN